MKIKINKTMTLVITEEKEITFEKFEILVKQVFKITKLFQNTVIPDIINKLDTNIKTNTKRKTHRYTKEEIKYLMLFEHTITLTNGIIDNFNTKFKTNLSRKAIQTRHRRLLNEKNNQ